MGCKQVVIIGATYTLAYGIASLLTNCTRRYKAHRIAKQSLVGMANASSPEALPDNAHNSHLLELKSSPPVAFHTNGLGCLFRSSK